MPKKRVADIARERGLEPAEVARRLAEAGVKLSGDTVDEAAAARALGGSRPARNGKRQAAVPTPLGRAAEPVEPHRPARPAAASAPQGQRSGAPAQAQQSAGAPQGRSSAPPQGRPGSSAPREGGGAPRRDDVVL